MARKSIVLLALGSVAAMIVGSLGPWARVDLFGSVNGTDGGGDGWFVIGAGVVALVLILLYARRQTSIMPLAVALLAGLASCAITIYDWTDLHRVESSFGGLIHSGWGIYVATIGSAGLAVSSAALLVMAPVKEELPTATVAHRG
jgi:hypothetical protein